MTGRPKLCAAALEDVGFITKQANSILGSAFLAAVLFVTVKIC